MTGSPLELLVLVVPTDSVLCVESTEFTCTSAMVNIRFGLCEKALFGFCFQYLWWRYDDIPIF